MPAYSLGSFSFIFANVEGVRGGSPPLPIEHVATFNTPGVDGVAIRNDGSWGEPFPYRTCAYTTDPIALQQLYQLAAGTVPQNLVWEGVDYDTANVRFSVLTVGQFEINRAYNLIVDGTDIGTRYLLYANWALLPVRMA